MAFLVVPNDVDLSISRLGLFEEVAVGFLLGYDKAHTRSAYQSDLRCFASWCTRIGIDPLDAQQAHLDGYARSLDSEGLASSSVARLFRYAYEEGTSPVIRRRMSVGPGSVRTRRRSAWT